jgi:hypothetical protein
VSDGVQTLISERFPGTIFCAVETSGDGAVNFYSRVQMYLFKAKQAAQNELDRALAESGVTMDQVREFLAKNPRFDSALHRAPHSAGCTASDLVYEVAEHITKTPWQRTREGAVKALNATKGALTRGVTDSPEHAKVAIDLSRKLSAEILEIAREKAPELAASARAALRERAAKVLPFVLPRMQNVAAAAG